MNPIFQPLVDELAKLSAVVPTVVTALKNGTLSQADKDAVANATVTLTGLVDTLTAAVAPTP